MMFFLYVTNTQTKQKKLKSEEKMFYRTGLKSKIPATTFKMANFKPFPLIALTIVAVANSAPHVGRSAQGIFYEQYILV
jgi:hypothetical protein